MTDIDKLIKNSKLVESENALLCLNNGWYVNESDSEKCNQTICSIYKGRLIHTQGKKGEHAKRLTIATKEFIENLQSCISENGKFVSLTSPDGPEFLLYISIERECIIGCLYVVHRDSVSETEHETMWNGSV